MNVSVGQVLSRELSIAARRQNIAQLFRPKSVAVIGASATPGKRGHFIIDQMQKVGFAGKIYPINPTYEEILGCKCYPDLASLPERPDIAAICLGASAVPAMVEACGKAGITSVAVVAAGFADAGPDGERLQSDMMASAERYGMSIMGVNGIGILNRLDRMQYWMTPPTDAEYKETAPSGVSAVLQSGALGLTVTADCLERGLALDYVVSAGSQISIDACDYIDWLLTDKRTETRVIALVLEGIRKPDAFRLVARRALQQGVALVVMMSGKSESTKEFIASHSGSMVGSSDVANQIFADDGVIAVSDMNEWIEQIVIQAHARKPKGNRWLMFSPTGGGNAIMSDIAGDIGLDVPRASAGFAKAMQRFGDREALNPFDAGGYYDAPGVAEATAIAGASDPDTDVVLECLTMSPVPGRGHINYLNGFIAAANTTDKPMFYFTISSGPVGALTRDKLREAGLYALKGDRPVLLALKRWLWWNERHRAAQGEASQEALKPAQPAFVPLPSASGFLTASVAQAMLSGAGLSLAPSRVVSTAAQAIEAAADWKSPIVLKVDHPELLHKTEIGGVIVSLVGTTAITDAFRKLSNIVIPATKLYGAKVVAQKQLVGGIELLLSALQDPVFGPYVMVGLGGIHTEIFKDYAVARAPLSKDGALKLLKRLKSFRLLDGYRNGQRFDIEAAVHAIVALSNLAAALGPRLQTIELNPVIVMPEGQGAWVIDIVANLQTTTSASPASSPVHVRDRGVSHA